MDIFVYEQRLVQWAGVLYIETEEGNTYWYRWLSRPLEGYENMPTNSVVCSEDCSVYLLTAEKMRWKEGEYVCIRRLVNGATEDLLVYQWSVGGWKSVRE